VFVVAAALSLTSSIRLKLPGGKKISLQGAEFAFSKQNNVTTVSNFTRFALPNEFYLEDYPDYLIDMVTFGTSDRNKTITFKKNDTLLWSLTVIKRDNDKSPATISDFTAMECGLSYCVQNITSNVVNSTLTENVTVLPVDVSKGAYQVVEGGGNDNESLPDSLWDAQYTPRTELQLMANDTGFNVSQAAINAIGDFMNRTFVLQTGMKLSATGFYVSSPPRQGQDSKKRENKPSDLDSGPQFQPNVMQQIYTYDINETFQALAASMSINFRANDANRAAELGTTLVTVYKVRWVWITLPVLSVLSGTVFLGFTMFYSYKYDVPLWKSSSLAILKFGEQIGEVLGKEEMIGEMEDKAHRAHITLGEGKRLLLGIYQIHRHPCDY
jgi:hypothetical protein